MPTANYVALAVFVLIGGYWVYHTRVIRRGFIATKGSVARVEELASEHEQRVELALEATKQNTLAVLEQTRASQQNNELLRELIAVNRQILDKQNQGNP